MAYEIILGRDEVDKKTFGLDGAIFLGKHYVKMGQVTSLSNNIYLDMIRSHTVFVCGKRGGGKCLHGNTLITLDDGSLVKIRDLKNDQRGIISLNENLKIETSTKSEFFERYVNRILYIKLRSGKELKLTPEHPLLTVRGWIPAENLHIGSRIATPRKIEIFGDENIRESEVKLLAYLIAEGHLRNNYVLFSNTDKKIINDFRKAVKEFDSSLLIKHHSKSGCFRVIANRKRTTKNALRDKKGKFIQGSCFEKSPLKKYFEDFGLYGNLSNTKFIPRIIFKSTRRNISLFLNRLFSCDGAIYKDKNTQSWRISYCSSSRTLIRQVQHLLLRFEIIGVIRSKKVTFNNKDFKSYEIEIRGEGVYNFLNNIGFFGSKEEIAEKVIKEVIIIKRNPNVDTIPKEIWGIYRPKNWVDVGRNLNYSTPKALRTSINYSVSRQKLLAIAKADEDELMEKLACSDIFWDEIVQITEIIGKEKVYDISVPVNHNFVANDIIVHNSYTMGVIAEGMTDLPQEIKQNLSVVIFDTMGVYWTMKYPNKQEEELLDQWGIKAKELNVQIYTPLGFYKEFKEKGIPTDFAFSINPSDLSVTDWCLSFDISLNDPVGILIERVIHVLKEQKKNYSVDDIINSIQDDKRVEQHIKDAAENRFIAAKTWGLFSEKGTNVDELIKGGQVTVIDVSCYAFTPGAEGIRALVIGLVSQKLFFERMIARKNEEFQEVHKTVHYIVEDDVKQKKEKPLIWIVVDEAHEFIPNEGKTAASNALITILREGRQPGISLVLASQQPGKIHTDVMTQSDIVIAHRVTAKMDVEALGMLMQTYMREGLDKELNNLPSAKGSAIAFDDVNERTFPMKIRPRFTWHGGSSPLAYHKKEKKFEL